MLAAYAEDAPLLVLLDDVQWLDGSTREALLFALRRLVADPIAVVLWCAKGCRRSSTVPTCRSVASRARPRGGGELLAGSCRPSVDRLHEATAGNPLALIELGRTTRTRSRHFFPRRRYLSSSRIARAFLGRSASLTGLRAAASCSRRRATRVT